MRIFRSWNEAGQNRTKTRWRKLGYSVCGTPTGIVVVETGKVRGKIPSDLVLEDLGEDRYLVVTNFYEVWAPAQTVLRSSVSHGRKNKVLVNVPVVEADANCVLPSEPANPIGNLKEDKSSSSLPSSSLSFDRRCLSENVAKNKVHKELGHENGHEFSIRRLEPAKGTNSSHSAYFPRNFSEEDYGKVGTLIEPAALVFDQLFKFRHYGEYHRDDFINLNYDWCDRLIYKFRDTIRLLLNERLLERTDVVTDKWGLGIELPRGKGTGISYGYRLVNPEYRENYHKVVLKDKHICRRLDSYNTVKYPVQRWLKKNLERLEAVMPEEEWLLGIAQGDRRRADIYRSKLKLVQDRLWLFNPDTFSRRIHNNLTALKRETRAFLRVDGDTLAEIDIKCSQWLFLALVCMKKGIADAERFLRICEHDLYEYIANMGGWSRERVKETLTKRCLFAPNGHRCQKTKIKKTLDREFPTIAAFIRRQKDGKPTVGNPKPWNKLARTLQKEECNFVVFTVCERIRKERPELFVGTIHDSLLCRSQEVGYLQTVLVEEFARVGTTPRLEPKEKLCA